MSNQSFTNRIRDPEQRAETAQELEDYGRRNKQPLIVGVVVGLLLGLFIGWVAWPIQWDNAWPPDLADKAKADYIAAVADAFVAARSDDAAAIAYQRLSSFGDKMQAELDAAEAYFEKFPTSDSAMRITNIQELAASMQPAATPEPPADAAEIDVAAEAANPTEIEDSQDQVTPSEQGESSNWLQLALWLLAAFVLIVGGIWVLRTVISPQSTQSTTTDSDDEDEIDEFTEEDFDNPHYDQPEFEEAHQARADDAGVIAGASVVTGAAITHDADDDFDSEIVATGEMTGGSTSDQSLQASAVDPVDDGEEHPSIAVRAGTAGAASDSAFYDDEEGYGFGPETDLPEGGGSSTVFVDTEPASTIVETQTIASTTSGKSIAPVSDTATGDAPRSAFLASGREVGSIHGHLLSDAG